MNTIRLVSDTDFLAKRKETAFNVSSLFDIEPVNVPHGPASCQVRLVKGSGLRTGIPMKRRALEA